MVPALGKLGGRSTVGHVALDHVIGVRIPASQPLTLDQSITYKRRATVPGTWCQATFPRSRSSYHSLHNYRPFNTFHQCDGLTRCRETQLRHVDTSSALQLGPISASVAGHHVYARPVTRELMMPLLVARDNILAIARCGSAVSGSIVTARTRAVDAFRAQLMSDPTTGRPNSSATSRAPGGGRWNPEPDDQAVHDASAYVGFRQSSEARWFDFKERNRVDRSSTQVDVTYEVTVKESRERERANVTVALFGQMGNGELPGFDY